jgi:hypothetical protein
MRRFKITLSGRNAQTAELMLPPTTHRFWDGEILKIIGRNIELDKRDRASNDSLKYPSFFAYF